MGAGRSQAGQAAPPVRPDRRRGRIAPTAAVQPIARGAAQKPTSCEQRQPVQEIDDVHGGPVPRRGSGRRRRAGSTAARCTPPRWGTRVRPRSGHTVHAPHSPGRGLAPLSLRQKMPHEGLRIRHLRRPTHPAHTAVGAPMAATIRWPDRYPQGTTDHVWADASCSVPHTQVQYNPGFLPRMSSSAARMISRADCASCRSAVPSGQPASTVAVTQRPSCCCTRAPR